MKYGITALLASVVLSGSCIEGSAASLDYSKVVSGSGTGTAIFQGTEGTQFTFSDPNPSAQFESVYSPILYSGAIDDTPFTITFSRPLTAISFEVGVAQSGTNAASVELFNGLTSLGTTSLADIGQGAPFSAVGSFTSAKVQVTSTFLADVGFDYGAQLGEISYLSAVPLPAALPMFGAGVLVLGLVGAGLKRKTVSTV